MRIYISGKISGLPIEEAKVNFENAEAFLIEEYGHRGVMPSNPFKLNHEKAEKLEKELEYKRKCGNISQSEIDELIKAIWIAYMDVDMAEILRCDAIYMLKGWGHSKGARIEYAIAKELGIKIFYEGQ